MSATQNYFWRPICHLFTHFVLCEKFILLSCFQFKAVMWCNSLVTRRPLGGGGDGDAGGRGVLRRGRQVLLRAQSSDHRGGRWRPSMPFKGQPWAKPHITDLMLSLSLPLSPLVLLCAYELFEKVCMCMCTDHMVWCKCMYCMSEHLLEFTSTVCNTWEINSCLLRERCYIKRRDRQKSLQWKITYEFKNDAIPDNRERRL